MQGLNVSALLEIRLSLSASSKTAMAGPLSAPSEIAMLGPLSSTPCASGSTRGISRKVKSVLLMLPYSSDSLSLLSLGPTYDCVDKVSLSGLVKGEISSAYSTKESM